MKVTIFGFAGTGKSSVAQAVSDEFGWEFMSNGNLFRALAEEKGITLNELDDLAEKDVSIDKEVDARAKQYGETHDNFVFEARLAWYFIPDSVKIKLACEDGERLRRIAGRDNISIEEARMQTIDREATYYSRFKKAHNIEDFSSDEHFDFVLDTTEIDLLTVISRVEDYIVNHPRYV